MSTDALYYPWIDPPSKVMLINALLYWDHLYTIVPESEDRPFQHLWTRAAHDYGFLLPRKLDPFSSEVSRASTELTNDLKRPAVNKGISQVKGWQARRDAQGFRIKPGKLSEGLLPQNLTPTLRKRIWKDTTLDEDGYIRMNREYALPYMSRLASVVADKDGMTAFTDQRWSRDVVVDRYVDLVKENPVGANEAYLATLSFNTIRVGSHVSFAHVMDFRDSQREALKHYRKAVHDLARQVASAGSANAQEREMQRIVKEVFKPAHEEVAAKLKEAGCDFGFAVAQVTGSAAVGGFFGGVPGALVAGLVSIGISAVQWRIARNRVLRNHPMTYLVEFRRQFHEDPDQD